METTDKSNRTYFPAICGIVTLALICLLCFFIFTSNGLNENDCRSYYNFLFNVFSLLSFLVMITGGTFITYKTYLIHFHEKCKRVDYLNELYLEEFQKEKYSQEQEKLKKDEKLEEFIKGAVNSAIEKNQKTYESTLNSLKKNVTLYNDVKKIMETKDNTEQ